MQFHGPKSRIVEEGSQQAYWRLAPEADQWVRPYARLLNQRAAVAVCGLGFGGDYYRRGYSVSWLQLQQARRGRNAANVRGCPAPRTKRGRMGQPD